ncbi:FtsK/SpoIIIE domain-containing protein [Streptomyces sp. NPDC051662]|uniref:FtsK/SpoIIIE domain-containing protein n=1 Tax=Streptomyces sp. NPDC051662 TaxID=3154750 RepID=UPI0034377CA4
MGRKNNPAPVNTSSEIVPVGKGGIGGYLLGKMLPYTAPWIGAATLPPLAGFATNAMWGDAPLSAGLASAALAVGGAGLTAVTWKATPAASKFGKFRRAQATASVAAGMGWLTCATAAGPFGSPLMDTWLLGGALFATSWNLRQILRNGASGDVEETNGGGLAALASAIGWEKVKVKDAKGSGKGTIKAEVEVAPGGTIADVQGTTAKLAAALQVPPAGVIVTPDPDNAARGTLSLRVADLLKGGVPFAAPTTLGLLPTEDIPVGFYADGEVWALNPFAAAILQHVLVMGVTGAGKSEFMRGLVVHLATRRKMTIFLVDVAKGRQSVGRLADGIDWLIEDKKTAKRLLRALPAAITARANVLADEGLDQWTPESSLNAMLVWIEEAADLADFNELNEIAAKARSVGIWLGISLQRATWTNISTDIRANLQAAVCFGVNEASDASFALPDFVTDTGAVPSWGARRPGYAIATGMGIPEERWTTEVRSGLTDHAVLADLVAAAAFVRDPLDEVTATALGQAYAQRAHKGTNRTTPGVGVGVGGAVPPELAGIPVAPLPGSAPAGGHSAPADTDAGYDEMDDDMLSSQEEDAQIEYEEAREEILGGIPADPEPDAAYASLRLEDDVDPDVDPDGEMDGEMEFGPAEDDSVSTEEARHILYLEMDEWVRTGRLEFEPADLIPATVAAQRKRPWMQGELKRLVEAGLITRDGHGSYSILHSPLQPA